MREHVNNAHDVLLIASTENHDSQGRICYVRPSIYQGSDGALVHRVPYHPAIPHRIARKLRIHRGVFSLLQDFSPEVILFHGACGWELRTVSCYKKANPSVRLFVDSHEDWNNSARTFLSRELLHRRFYGRILRSVLPEIEKILCVTPETMDFVEDLYHIDPQRLEFFPLGGHPCSDSEFTSVRAAVRKELAIDDECIMFIQSGKQTKRKKLLETLDAFSSVADKRFRLYVVGSLFEEIREKATKLIQADSRIQFLGWRPAEHLRRLLIASDVYLQPGTQSVTMQQSLCSGCAVVLDDVPSHVPYVSENGWLLNAKNKIRDVLTEISCSDRNRLFEMQLKSFELAKSMLDYSVLARRFYSEPDSPKRVSVD